tara:strand:+ start:586 stop:1173 length:588 start_codon:yes stop_codon:yes gene_type:complete
MSSPSLILTTERLILRTWQPSDIPLMAAISADPAVMEFFPSTQDLAATQRLVKLAIEHQTKHGYSLYPVETKDSHEFIGFVGLLHPSFQIPNFKPKCLPITEIGWRLSQTHWGKGYATEAAKAVLHLAMMQLNLTEIISFTAAVNSRSRKVMEKIRLQHDINDDFDHPSLHAESVLKRHVLYRISREAYLSNHQA